MNLDYALPSQNPAPSSPRAATGAAPQRACAVWGELQRQAGAPPHSNEGADALNLRSSASCAP